LAFQPGHRNPLQPARHFFAFGNRIGAGQTELLVQRKFGIRRAGLRHKPAIAVGQQADQVAMRSQRRFARCLICVAHKVRQCRHRASHNRRAHAWLGEQPYIDLLGHHLMQGYGVGTRSDLAFAWYKVGIDAIAGSQAAAFAAGNPERIMLIQQAAFQLNGIGDQSGLASASGQVQPVSTLPTFLSNDTSGN